MEEKHDEMNESTKFYNESRKKIYRFNATIIAFINQSAIFAFFEFFFFSDKLIKG